jgi:hypothetical protein
MMSNPGMAKGFVTIKSEMILKAKRY